MKRQGDNIVNQPAVKKPDVSVTTDLRSKIGAKLQTLLNGVTPETRLSPRNRRQLYEDLFGVPQHSEIIIDPKRVVKTEPDIEECSSDTTSLNSPNFLMSAKTRLTELLNKKQDGANTHQFKDNEKENALSSNKCTPTSSFRSNSSHTQTSNKSQSLSSSSLSKKRKFSNNKEDPTINQVRLKNLVVVVEDFMNSTNSSEFSHLLPNNKNIESENCSLNLESNSGNTISEQNKNVVAKDDVTNEISDLFVPSETVECVIDEGISAVNELSSDPNISTDDCNSSENSPELNASKSPETDSECVLLDDCDVSSKVVTLEDILLEKNTNEFPYGNVDDSELVDDPDMLQPEVDIASGIVSSHNNDFSNTSIHEPEVVLLCVKRPIHEVITLEDNDDSDDVIEEVHECYQCGKAFRAKSLLNFHIRMHGGDLSLSSSSSSQSCS